MANNGRLQMMTDKPDTEKIYRAALVYGQYANIETDNMEDIIPSMMTDLLNLAKEYAVATDTYLRDALFDRLCDIRDAGTWNCDHRQFTEAYGWECRAAEIYAIGEILHMGDVMSAASAQMKSLQTKREKAQIYSRDIRIINHDT